MYVVLCITVSVSLFSVCFLRCALRCLYGKNTIALLHCCTIGGCCVGGSKLDLCAVSGVLVTYCVGYSCCSVERLSLVQRGVLFRVAIKLSDLSHGTRLLLYGGWRGIGGSGFIVWFYWGFSKASKILLGDMLYSSFKWLCLVNSE